MSVKAVFPKMIVYLFCIYSFSQEWLFTLRRKYLSHRPGLGDEYERSLDSFLIPGEV